MLTGLAWEELCDWASILLHRYNLCPTTFWVSNSCDAPRAMEYTAYMAFEASLARRIFSETNMSCVCRDQLTL